MSELAGQLFPAATLVRSQPIAKLGLTIDVVDGTAVDERDGERRKTSLGIAVSRHVMPDGRTDWVLSSEHRHWSAAIARSLAHLLWPSFEFVPGQTPNVFHVLTAKDA